MSLTRYCWDVVTDSVLFEEDESGTVVAEYTQEPTEFGELASQHRDGQSNYYHFDGEGSLRALTDGNQTVTDTVTYTAFGEEVVSVGDTTNPFKYKAVVGYYLNAETNDVYVRARTYWPAAGRWRSSDPLGAFSGDLNLYHYVMNRPLVLIDPLGLQATIGPAPYEFSIIPIDIQWKTTRYNYSLQGKLVRSVVEDEWVKLITSTATNKTCKTKVAKGFGVEYTEGIDRGSSGIKVKQTYKPSWWDPLFENPVDQGKRRVQFFIWSLIYKVRDKYLTDEGGKHWFWYDLKVAPCTKRTVVVEQRHLRLKYRGSFTLYQYPRWDTDIFSGENSGAWIKWAEYSFSLNFKIRTKEIRVRDISVKKLADCCCQ